MLLRKLVGFTLICVAASIPSLAQTSAGRILIPASSVRRSSDAGVRAHTNIELYINSDPSAPAPTAETPASIACVYQMVTTVSGCPIASTVNLPQGGAAAIIVIVDAYDDPTAASDLAAFSTYYGLPQAAFEVIYASGSKPAQDPTGQWELEESLDIEWAHAMAPNATIYLVEANSNSTSDLYAAEKVSALSFTGIISNSWGTPEYSGEQDNDSDFALPGVVYIASIGDTTGVIDYPAASPNVIAAGGTQIVRNGSGDFTGESYWSSDDGACGNGGGGGISAYESRPSYQSGIASLVGSHRGTPDISSDASGCSPVSVYDSTPYEGVTGPWFAVLGTSVAAPTLAGRIMSTTSGAYSSNQMLTQLYDMYAASSVDAEFFRDITTGSSSCTSGWNICDGIGSPLLDTWSDYVISRALTEGSEQLHCGEMLNGECIKPVYDSGTVTLTINGKNYTVSYGEGSTLETVTAGLVGAVNDADIGVTASNAGRIFYLASTSIACFTASSTSKTNDPLYFSEPSFFVIVGTPACG
jgi:kumamolisin